MNKYIGTMNIEKNYPSQLGSHNRGVIDSSLNKRIKNNNLVTDPDNVKSPHEPRNRQQDSLIDSRLNYGHSHLSNGSSVMSGGRIKSPSYLR